MNIGAINGGDSSGGQGSSGGGSANIGGVIKPSLYTPKPDGVMPPKPSKGIMPAKPTEGVKPAQSDKLTQSTQGMNGPSNINFKQSMSLEVNTISMKKQSGPDNWLAKMVEQVLELQKMLLLIELLKGGNSDKARKDFDNQLKTMIGLNMIAKDQGMLDSFELQMEKQQIEVSSELSTDLDMNKEDLMEMLEAMNEMTMSSMMDMSKMLDNHTSNIYGPSGSMVDVYV